MMESKFMNGSRIGAFKRRAGPPPDQLAYAGFNNSPRLICEAHVDAGYADTVPPIDVRRCPLRCPVTAAGIWRRSPRAGDWCAQAFACRR